MRHTLIGIPMGAGVAAETFKSFIPAINLLPEEGSVTIQYWQWSNPIKARNGIVKDFLDGEFTHLFFMDSDMSFPVGALSRLLAHDLDIVGGLYTMKTSPFATTIFGDRTNGSVRNLVPKLGDGVMEVSAIGTGCLLIRREVFESTSWPWFWYEEDPPGSKEIMTEDSYFCIKARDKGYKVYCDTDLICGHVGSCLVSPEFTEDGLKVGMKVL